MPRTRDLSGSRSSKRGLAPVNPTLRILSGSLKGRSFRSPVRPGTHPMGAREKLALFNMLQPVLAGAHTADCYAGSGALGIEALSRGAAHVTFVEQSAAVARALQSNLAALDLSARARLIVSSVKQFAAQSSEQFDLVIADLPYDQLPLSDLELLPGLLAPQGTLALSFPSALTPPVLPGLEQISYHTYAAASLILYRKTTNSSL